MPDKVTTIMVLKADLQCSKCYKKVKKVLCKFPQIQDQIYDEKQNTVTIKVVCCCPEKIRDKICCKGDGVIKSIEIKSPEKPKEPEKKKETEKKKEPEKPKEPEKKKEPEKPKEPEKKKEPEKPKEPEKKKEHEKPKEPEKKKEPKVTFVDPPKSPEPVAPGYPPPYYPFGVCCPECYGGHGGGPCYRGQQPPPIWYDGYYGRPVYDSWGSGDGGSRKYYDCRSNCLSEENPSACAIM